MSLSEPGLPPQIQINTGMGPCALLKEFFEHVPEAIVFVDGTCRVVRANREFVRMFGYAPEEIIGTVLSSLIVPPDLRYEAEQLTASASQTETLCSESVCVRKGGAASFVRYLEDHGLKHFRMKASLQRGRLHLFPNCLHFVDLLCAFLLDECHDKDPSEMPIKVCRHCSQLFASQRKEADFCSEKCRTKSFWTDERKRDYTYVDRLEKFANTCSAQVRGFSLQNLRDKLNSPKSETRLREVEARWHDWPKLIDKVKKIRAMIGSR
jgi:PAS domain S-box-containing protein